MIWSSTRNPASCVAAISPLAKIDEGPLPPAAEAYICSKGNCK